MNFRKMLEAIEEIVSRYYPLVEENNPLLAESDKPTPRAAAAGGQ